jgi:ribosomal-protein-alanine N-acetyltransferase
VLRTPAAADVPAILEFLAEERREMAWSAPIRPPSAYTAAGQRKAVRVAKERRRRGEGLVLLVFVKGAGPGIAGRISFSNVVRGALQAAHLGYALRAEFRGRGLMTEAVRAALRHAFDPRGLALHRVMANHMPSNRASGRVLRRLGFRREGLARDYLRIAGRWEDHVLTALVNPRWREPVSAPPAPVRGRSRRRPPRAR